MAEDVPKTGLRTLTVESPPSDEIIFNLEDGTSKGELVPFQEPTPTQDNTGLLPVLKKVGRRFPIFRLLDLLQNNEPSPEEFKKRSEQVSSENKALLNSGLQTVIDFVKGKNPPISRRNFLKGMKTAGQMAVTPNILLPKKDPWKTVESAITLNPLSREEIIKNALELTHPTANLSNNARNMVGELFDFSTETGSYTPPSPSDEGYDEYEHILLEERTIDDIDTKNQISMRTQEEEIEEEIAERTNIKKGQWEELKDTFEFYDIEKDPEGTWKTFKEIAKISRNNKPISDSKSMFMEGRRLNRDINDALYDAWDYLQGSEINAEHKVKKSLDTYFKNFKKLDDGTFLGVNPEERIKMLRDKRAAKEKRLDKLYPDTQLSREEKEKLDALYSLPGSSKSASNDSTELYDRYDIDYDDDSHFNKANQFWFQKRYPELFKKPKKGNDYKKRSGGVIRNPYGDYSPRDI